MKMMMITLVIFFGCLLSGCSTESEADALTLMQEIKGRDDDGQRTPIYRVRIPDNWVRRDPLPTESLKDTTKALCEFLIYEPGESIRIAIHNFPSETMEQRIPPFAQVERWKQQFAALYSAESSFEPQAFNGYSGQLFIGKGLLEGKESMVMGWALQVAPEHYRTLSSPENENNIPSFKQMRADVTIKASGPKAFMEKHEAKIRAFARSFELIEEIPRLRS